MSSQQNSYPHVAALALVSVLGLAGFANAKQPASAPSTGRVTKSSTASHNDECMSVQDITKKGPDYYCVSPNMVGQSLCLRRPFEDPKHVRELKFPPGSLPEALITAVGGSPGRAKVDEKTPAVSNPLAPCGKHPIKFVNIDDKIVILPNQAKTGLTLNITDKNGNQKPHFPQPLELTPDPSGGHYFWKVTSDGIDFFVMLEDANLGHPSAKGIDWFERYILVEAFWTDQRSDTECEKRKPETPATGSVAYNFFSWDGDQATCPVQGATSQNGTGAGGHNEP